MSSKIRPVDGAERHCEVCGRVMVALKPNKVTCSPRCRQIRSRHKRGLLPYALPPEQMEELYGYRIGPVWERRRVNPTARKRPRRK